MTRREIQIRVRAFRESSTLLSRFAHDVEFTLQRFEVSESGSEVSVCFEPASLSVAGPVVAGTLDRSGLNSIDRAEIEKNVRREVLLTDQHPKGHFDGRAEGPTRDGRVRIRGDLELLGRRQEVAFELSRQGAWFEGTLTLVPSRWKIRPYRALLGALKLQDRVEVLVRASADPEVEAQARR